VFEDMDGVGNAVGSERLSQTVTAKLVRPARGNQRTTSVPCMNGWIAQWYA
jgi:hypothetical protein